MGQCLKQDVEQLSEIAEAGRAKNGPQRHSAEEGLTSTLDAGQRQNWMNLEEEIYKEQNNIQEAMVEALHCPNCTVKSCQ